MINNITSFWKLCFSVKLYCRKQKQYISFNSALLDLYCMFWVCMNKNELLENESIRKFFQIEELDVATKIQESSLSKHFADFGIESYNS